MHRHSGLRDRLVLKNALVNGHETEIDGTGSGEPVIEVRADTGTAYVGKFPNAGHAAIEKSGEDGFFIALLQLRSYTPN